MKSKQVLSIDQMKHLRELGLDTSDASMYWARVSNHPTDVIEDERFCIATSPVNCNYHIIIKGAFDATNPYRTWNCAGRIDCGTNEELFLAIAALRDDTDDNQWFTNGKGDWGMYRDGSDGNLPGMDFFGMPNDFDLSHYHKATVNELIEHFKI